MTATQIPTYKSRRGRMRTRRREAMLELLPRYGVEVTGGPLDPEAVFGRRSELVLEIGPGMGEHTARLAAADPTRDYLAAEPHAAGVANLLRLLDEARLANVRVAHGDALTLLRDRLALGSLRAIYVLFPDPWPKSRHRKRRLFQPAHVALLRDRLAPGGTLHAATDVAGYAEVIRATLTADPELVDPYQDWAPRPPGPPRTKYEQRAIAAGRPIFDLVAQRRSPGS